MAKLFVSNKDDTVRLFKSDFLESFSRVHPVVPLVLYVPIVGIMLYQSVISQLIAGSGIFVLMVAGIFTWTLAEYLLHRFFFHIPAKTPLLQRLYWVIHGIHHDYPNDSKRLVMPPAVSIPLAVFFFMIFSLMFGNALVYPFYAGFVSGYLLYDTTHYATHHFRMRGRLGQWLKQHHMRHHYQDNRKAFGVSSTVWDHVFRTMPEKKNIAEAVADV